uniref:Uncharacterized protein n=1 Tax=Rhizophora mucronata TaxID=61149 RepID=A0A2P2IVR4_RHIMU
MHLKSTNNTTAVKMMAAMTMPAIKPGNTPPPFPDPPGFPLGPVEFVLEPEDAVPPLPVPVPFPSKELPGVVVNFTEDANDGIPPVRLLSETSRN